MTDIIDTANDMAQIALDSIIANAPKFDRPSTLDCEDCGEPIPPIRRQLGGVTRCADCQTHFEKTRRNYRGN